MSRGDNDMIGLYKVELQAVSGNGKLNKMGGAAQPQVRDAINVAFNYFKANSSRVSGSINSGSHDYLLSMTDLQGSGSPDQISLALLVALCGAALGRSVQSQMAILGGMTIGGTITPVANLASSLQVAFDCGAKRILIPTANAADIGTVPGELFAKFQTSFYSDPVDGVFKALGVS